MLKQDIVQSISQSVLMQVSIGGIHGTAQHSSNGSVLYKSNVAELISILQQKQLLVLHVVAMSAQT